MCQAIEIGDMATKLSVNINKIALIRNSRGSNLPDIATVARDLEAFGADGITVHPRPDERHIRYDDLPVLKELVTTEFNVEGYPSDTFLQHVLNCKPHQCTLVPDAPGALTSDDGWDTLTHKSLLQEVIGELKSAGVRVSLFINPDTEMIDGAKSAGADRIEFYTGPYAKAYYSDKEKAIAPIVAAAKHCNNIGIGINAGHDLNLDNLHYFKSNVPGLLEVSIGHALVCDALYFGLQNVVQMYQYQLSKS